MWLVKDSIHLLKVCQKLNLAAVTCSKRCNTIRVES